jgi:molybdenum cofactor synthesis domain-containing protein
MIGKRAACVRKVAASALALTVAGWSSAASAASAASVMPDGAALGPQWAIPFVGILLSIALFPLIAPAFWHRHFGKIAAAWAIAFLAPFGYAFGAAAAADAFAHAVVAEYVPFIVLLTALYTVAGGICVRGALHGSPRVNAALLALGTALASIMGTTGAAMLLIRPLLRANENRRHIVHVFVFFIFLVANVGGSLSPLGDPPLFLGFLNGVSFFWTTRHLALPMLFVCAVLLAVFYALDAYYYRRPGEAGAPDRDRAPEAIGIVIEGKRNFALLAVVIGLVLMSGLWKPGIAFDVLGAHLALQDVVRDASLVVLTLVSLVITPRTARTGNAFTWAPIEEVAKLFGAIFITIAPVVMMLRAGEDGAFASVLHLVTGSNGQPIDAGCVYDSNRYTLYAMLERMNVDVDVLDLGVIRDEPSAIEAALRSAAASADVVLTSGGVSVGDADFTARMTATLGDVAFWQLAMRPGRPLAFGRLSAAPGSSEGGALFFGLPGNPVAVMVSFYQFVRDALIAMSGANAAGPLQFAAASSTPIKKRPGRTEFLRAVAMRDAAGQWSVTPTPAQGSGVLSSMSRANCFIVLAHEQGDVAAGTPVDIMPFEGLI